MERHIDFRHKVSVPIRDMQQDGRIAFFVDVYGVEPSDLLIIPGGSEPMRQAVKRMGLDVGRFQASIWDIPGGLHATRFS